MGNKRKGKERKGGKMNKYRKWKEEQEQDW